MAGTLTPPRPRPRPPSRPPVPRTGGSGRPPTTARRARERVAERRRLVAFLVVAVLGFCALGGRLVSLQVNPPAAATALSERQMVHHLTLPAARGAIFDRNGQELALSVRQSTVWANPRQVTDPAGEAATLAPMLGVDENLLRARLSRDAAFVYLARTVPDSVAAQVDDLGLPGVHLLEEPKRFTPADGLAAPVLGKVGTDNSGLSGVEMQYEKVLAGRAGTKIVEQTPAGQPYDGLRSLTAPVRGDDLVLTLDRSLQFETERALADEISVANAHGGVAIVMDTVSGEILALANLTADPEGKGRRCRRRRTPPSPTSTSPDR